MSNLNSNDLHVREVLKNISKGDFQLVKIFHNQHLFNNHYKANSFDDCINHTNNTITHKSLVGRSLSNGVAVVKNKKLAGRLEDIKFLASLEPESRKRFLNEGKILSAMHHKNIPQVYDILEYEEILLFRYEHIEGYSLKEILDYLRHHKILIPKHVCTSIILKVLNALYYAHNEVRYEGQKKSIIHCDIKPSNIILCSKNYTRQNVLDDKFIGLLIQNKVEPFLIDFGIAKFRGKATMEGTLNYLSPAQISNRQLDWRTDIYQLILVYYELLTLEMPYSDMPRNKLLDHKLKHDFILDKSGIFTSSVKEFIEKGTARNPSKSFKSEKDCLNALSGIEHRQKRFDLFSRYEKHLTITIILVLCAVLFFIAYRNWDYNTNSVDAIVIGIENNPHPTLAQLETAMQKIQIRSFEKKYYEPLLRGEFRDKNTGAPHYPSRLDSNGNWVLVGPENDNAGVFVGLLFYYAHKYPQKYPHLLDYAKEYAEPILNSQFDGSAERRYMDALIPGYDETKDARYMNKLINVTDTLIANYYLDDSTTQCNDMYTVELALAMYNRTGKSRYMDFSKNVSTKFIADNIDRDGYIYLVATLTENDDTINYERWGKLVTPIGAYSIGTYYGLSNISEYEFKSLTSPFSRDFVEVMIVLHDMESYSSNYIYAKALDSTSKYYVGLLSPEDYVDYLFVSRINKENNIPKDTLSAVKSLRFFKNADNLKDINTQIYYYKLRGLLSSKYFLKDDDKAILSGSVFIESMRYDNNDKNLRNQSMINTDALFLKLN